MGLSLIAVQTLFHHKAQIFVSRGSLLETELNELCQSFNHDYAKINILTKLTDIKMVLFAHETP